MTTPSRPVRVAAALALLALSAAAQHERKLRFVVIGHLRGDANGELLQNLDELVESVRREDPDLVFLCGDLIWGDVPDPEQKDPPPTDPAVILADWERLDQKIVGPDGMGAPVHRVPGNHDVNDIVTRDVWQKRYGALPQSVTLGNSLFLLLDSGWWPEDGATAKHPQDKIRGVPLDAGQIAYVRSELGSHPEAEHVFLFMHHLLWWEDSAPWWRDVAPEFVGHPVRAVFSGDYGPLKFSHLERGGIHYLQTSVENQVSDEMLRGKESSRLLSAQLDNYIVVDVDGADVRYSVRTVGGLTTGKFSPSQYRRINEYDKGTVGRKLLSRWSTSNRLLVGLAQVSGVAFVAGALAVASVLLLRSLLARKRT